MAVSGARGKMVGMARESVRRAVRGRKPRWLLTGAVVSLFGYLALAALAAQQQIFALDYGTRAWVAILSLENSSVRMIKKRRILRLLY